MANESIKNVIVLGAGGNLGPFLISALRAAGFTVSILTRPSSTASFPSDIAVHRADYNDFPSLVKAFQGQDAVVSALGTFNVPAQKTAIDAAVASKVKRFIPSEYGGNTAIAADPGLEFLSFAKDKVDIVNHLKSKESEGLSWTAICTGIFFDWMLELGNGFLGWDIENQKATIYDSGAEPFEASTVDRVAEAVVATLQHTEKTKNTYIYVNSFTVTQNQVLSILEKLSGKKYEITAASARELAVLGKRHVDEGEERGYLEIVTASMYGPWDFDKFKGKEVKWKEALGLSKDEDVEAVIRGILEKKHLI